MASNDLAQFYETVAQDAALRERLEAAPDNQSFLRLAVQLGREKGYRFETEDVEASFKNAPAAALGDDDLQKVAGGTIWRANVDRDDAVVVKLPPKWKGCFPYCQSA
jgi:predicted ribosomally synthesized peptide with nif11-like leader